MRFKTFYKLSFLGLFLASMLSHAQVENTDAPLDDLGEVDDQFQELFFEALKQSGIENYMRSVDALQKCIAINPTESVLFFEMGKNYNKLKNFGEAESALKKAVKLEPDNEWYLDELYDVYAQQNDYDKAIKTLKQLVKYHPDYREDLAALFVRTKDYDEAIKVLDQLDEEYGVSLSRDFLRNQIYDATGQKKEQIENLEARVENNPDQESNYLALIYRYSESGNTEKAFETAKKLLEINPESQLVHLALYKFYLDDNEPEKAIASMEIAMKSPQIKAEAKVLVLADFVRFVGENPEYEDELVTISTMVGNSNDGKTLVELAQYYLTKGDKEKAIKYYSEALQLEGDNYGISRNIIVLHIDLKQYDLAYKKTAETLVKYPSQPELYLMAGVSLNKINRFEDAIEQLKMGLDYIIDDKKMESDFYYQIAQSYLGLNQPKEAKRFTDKANKFEISE
ncbi:tetratricopeptide repeat protein [Formosa sediminum]|uniref:Tetratricopeptide repeat protein n=1 Tax=Formosa sediminum TaxID=2594004 RepID=A0A516GNM0_9FLAO|nr:tetratricopeptide repeat protein [Formosa sediminum]QDO93117.1 tetratricopeptide repeat protein [Formosa sediminum]